MRKFISAIILGLLFVSQSYSIEPYVYKPLPSEYFSKVVIEPIIDSFIPTPAPTILKPVITAKPIIVETSEKTTLSGIASWYCLNGVSRCTIGYSGGYYAAIRKDLLELRGKYVLVCAGKGNCVRVKVIDCNCGPNANLIDLYWDAFNAISNPTLGRIKVTVSWT